MAKKKSRPVQKTRPSQIFDLSSDEDKKKFASEFGIDFKPDSKSKSDYKNQSYQKTKSEVGKGNSKGNKTQNKQITDLHDVELPKDARTIFENTDNINIQSIDNLYLLHQRFSGKFYYQYRKRKKDRKSKSLESFLKFIYTDSLEYVEDKIQEARRNRVKPLPSSDQLLALYYKNSAVYVKGKKLCRKLCSTLSERTTKIVENYMSALKDSYVEFNPSKLIVGIGGGAPYGNLLLMAFHPLYGIPYLPSSAIKGILRSYWEQEILFQEEDAKKTKVLEQLFGGEEKSGDLIFFDTFPQEFEIDFDVMAPHYGNYYGNDKPPTDDKSPVPIVFPYVKDAIFNIYVACERNEFIEKCLEIDNNKSNCWQMILKELCKSEKELSLQEIITATLTNALQIYGIGAKTALGYGLGT